MNNIWHWEWKNHELDENSSDDNTSINVIPETPPVSDYEDYDAAMTEVAAAHQIGMDPLVMHQVSKY